jgi:hypothetical protein
VSSEVLGYNLNLPNASFLRNWPTNLDTKRNHSKITALIGHITSDVLCIYAVQSSAGYLTGCKIIPVTGRGNP